MHHVAVGDLVVLAFEAQLAGLARAGLAAGLIGVAIVSARTKPRSKSVWIAPAACVRSAIARLPKLGIIFPNMGMAPPSSSPSDALFSKVQQRVLAVIFGHPERSFYTSEIIRTVRSGTGAVERELSRLESSGLVTAERIGNQKHYRANPDSPIFAELQALVSKTLAPAGAIKESLQPCASTIKAAFIYGSVARGTDTARSDVDLIVIGDALNFSDLYTAARNAEDKLRRKVNPLFLSPADWRRKASVAGSVLGKIRQAPKIFIVGSERDLHAGKARTRKSREGRQAQA